MKYFLFKRFSPLILTSVLFILPFAGFGNSVSVNQLTPASPARLNFGEEITISFNYNISEPRGARIFIRPVTGSNPTPNYAASGSDLYRGEGKAVTTFTITSGKIKVDKLRVQVYNANQSLLLFEFYFPVSYAFSSTPNNHTLAEMAVTPELQRPARRFREMQQGQTQPVVDTTEQPQNQPVTKKILPNGSVETTYPDGRIVTRFEGGFKVYDPETGQTQPYSFSTQARAPVPPSLPGDAELLWMVEHSENLLYIIKLLVNNDSASIENYLQYEGDQDIYNQIITREETISYMVMP